MKTLRISSLIALIYAFITLSAVSLLPVTVNAQTIDNPQANTNTNNLFNSSNQSNFQDSAFQQSGTSGATTASGSGSVLQQINPTPIVVTGAPALQLAPKTTSNNTLKNVSIVIFVVSALGLALTFVYSRRTIKQQSVAEQSFVTEVIAESEPTNTNKKEKQKKNKKNKKHHR